MILDALRSQAYIRLFMSCAYSCSHSHSLTLQLLFSSALSFSFTSSSSLSSSLPSSLSLSLSRFLALALLSPLFSHHTIQASLWLTSQTGTTSSMLHSKNIRHLEPCLPALGLLTLQSLASLTRCRCVHVCVCVYAPSWILQD